jgi:hypothetical protein
MENSDPGSEMEKSRFRIRDKHPGSATLTGSSTYRSGLLWTYLTFEKPECLEFLLVEPIGRMQVAARARPSSHHHRIHHFLFIHRGLKIKKNGHAEYFHSGVGRFCPFRMCSVVL